MELEKIAYWKDPEKIPIPMRSQPRKSELAKVRELRYRDLTPDRDFFCPNMYALKIFFEKRCGLKIFRNKK